MPLQESSGFYRLGVQLQHRGHRRGFCSFTVTRGKGKPLNQTWWAEQLTRHLRQIDGGLGYHEGNSVEGEGIR